VFTVPNLIAVIPEGGWCIEKQVMFVVNERYIPK
jgi:hypothetical protein